MWILLCLALRRSVYLEFPVNVLIGTVSCDWLRKDDVKAVSGDHCSACSVGFQQGSVKEQVLRLDSIYHELLQ